MSVEKKVEDLMNEESSVEEGVGVAFSNLKKSEREKISPYIGKKCGKSIRCHNRTDHTK